MNHTIIIAEAGVNHNGSIERAMEMIDVAKQCGVDYIKFQTFKADRITNKFATQAEYQRHNTRNEKTQLEMLRELELSNRNFAQLNEHCKKVGIRFMSTPFDMESFDFLAAIGMDYMKIPSGEITNLPYLRKISQIGIPVIMSTGMSEMAEIDAAINVLLEGKLTKEQIILLHCNTEYPTPMADVNLSAMQTISKAFGTRVGYSDHTQGIEVPIAAVAMGACVIEKHFTLNKTLPGPDHVASLNPEELKAMVDAIRNVEKAVGTPEKKVTESERKNITVARKSIVASRNICAGEILTSENLTVKRPGNGVSPMLWDSVIGTTANRNYQEDELIEI